MPVFIFFKQNRVARFLLYGCILLGLLSIPFFFRLRKDHVYASWKQGPENSFYFSYDDKEMKGNSRSSVESNEGKLLVRFALGSQAAYPYAGLSFPLQADVSKRNTLQLHVRVPKEMALHIIFSEHFRKGGGALQILQLTEFTLHCTPDKVEYAIPLSSFQIPIWWLKMNRKEDHFAIDWSKINTLSVQNDPMLAVGTAQYFTLEALDLATLIWWPFYMAILWLFSSILIEYFLKRARRRPADLRYVPIEEGALASDDPWEVVVHYVAEHYREDITLETVFLATGIGKHRVSSLMKEKASLNFRQYINGIRIREAERLFKETSLRVTEIGYEVGFTNATHFNRVFRELKGIAPSEYRKKNLS